MVYKLKSAKINIYPSELQSNWKNHLLNISLISILVSVVIQGAVPLYILCMYKGFYKVLYTCLHKSNSFSESYCAVFDHFGIYIVVN